MVTGCVAPGGAEFREEEMAGYGASSVESREVIVMQSYLQVRKMPLVGAPLTPYLQVPRAASS